MCSKAFCDPAPPYDELNLGGPYLIDLDPKRKPTGDKVSKPGLMMAIRIPTNVGERAHRSSKNGHGLFRRGLARLGISLLEGGPMDMASESEEVAWERYDHLLLICGIASVCV
jgi:hypothetical protein